MSKLRMTTLLTAGLSATLFLVSTVGCSMALSPAVGKWSGKMAPAPDAGGLGAVAATFATAALGNTPANLDLKGDGTGYMKVPTAPERPITWKADGDKIMVYGAAPSAAKNGASPSAEGIVGTLSSDKKTLTMDLGPLQCVMQKQEK